MSENSFINSAGVEGKNRKLISIPVEQEYEPSIRASVEICLVKGDQLKKILTVKKRGRTLF